MDQLTRMDLSKLCGICLWERTFGLINLLSDSRCSNLDEVVREILKPNIVRWMEDTWVLNMRFVNLFSFQSMNANETMYRVSQKWCGVISNRTGPWVQCLKVCLFNWFILLSNKLTLQAFFITKFQKLATDYVDDIVEGCVTDMSAFENDTSRNIYRCGVYESFNSKCLESAKSLNQTWTTNWRVPTNCRNKNNFLTMPFDQTDQIKTIYFHKHQKQSPVGQTWNML